MLNGTAWCGHLNVNREIRRVQFPYSAPIFGLVAQSGEHLPVTQEVTSSKLVKVAKLEKGTCMNKMLRKRKQFGRCNVQGHGKRCFCEVCEDIQTTPFTRAQDKREWKTQVNEQLNNC